MKIYCRLILIPVLCMVPLAAQPDGRNPPPARVLGRGPVPRPPAGNPTIFERLNRMTPQERERALSKLPPERREKIERGLARYNSLPEQDRDHLLQQFENFKSLPLEQQDAMRRNFRQFLVLTPERRIVVRRELQRLQPLTPEQRRQRMDSEAFRIRFSPPERRLLENFSRLMPVE